jgi:hypothetical protein
LVAKQRRSIRVEVLLAVAAVVGGVLGLLLGNRSSEEENGVVLDEIDRRAQELLPMGAPADAPGTGITVTPASIAACTTR